MPQVGRMTRQQISTLTLALALGLTSPLSAEAGGFRTGTYQTNDSSSSHRNITSGMEEIRSERTYTNTINGSSRVDHMEATHHQGDGNRKRHQRHGDGPPTQPGSQEAAGCTGAQQQNLETTMTLTRN